VNAPRVLRNISSKLVASQTSCRVVATVLVLTLYIAAIGNFVSTTKSDVSSSHYIVLMDSIFVIHYIFPHNPVTYNKGLAVTFRTWKAVIF